MPLEHFEMEQRVRLTEPQDERLKNRTATIVKINYDGSALARIDGEPGKRILGRTIWPDECEGLNGAG
jgi:hypothetical protein